MKRIRLQVMSLLFVVGTLVLTACGSGSGIEGAGSSQINLYPGAGDAPPDDDGTVSPDTDDLPPDDTKDPAPSTVKKLDSFTASDTSVDLGEMEVDTQTPLTKSVTVTNNTNEDAEATIYLDADSSTPTCSTDATSMCLVNDKQEETLNWTATVKKGGSLKIGYTVTRKTAAKVGATLIVTFPKQDKGFRIPIRGRIIPKVVALTAPANRISYFYKETSLALKGSVTDNRFFTKDSKVKAVVTHLEKDKDNKDDVKTDSTIEFGLTGNQFSGAVSIPEGSGIYTVTTSISDKYGKTFTAIRKVVRETLPDLEELSVIDAARNIEINPNLTDAQKLKVKATFQAPSTAGIVMATISLNGKLIATATAVASLTKGSVSFDLSAKDNFKSQSINTVTVTVSNRVGSVSKEMEFYFDNSHPTFNIDYPGHLSTIDGFQKIMDAKTGTGITVKGSHVTGIDLAAIQDGATTSDKKTIKITMINGDQCAPDTPETIRITHKVNGKDLTQDVDPCPIKLYVNLSDSQIDSVIRIRPRTTGDFEVTLKAAQYNTDSKTLKTPGLKFGVNTLLFLAENEQGHIKSDTVDFQLGDIAKGQITAVDDDLTKIVLPPVSSPSALTVNSTLFEDLLPYLNNYIGNSFQVGGYLKDQTPGMMECIKAAKTLFFRSSPDSYDQQINDALDACNKLPRDLYKISPTSTDYCAPSIHDAVTDTDKDNAPSFIIFSDDLKALKPFLNSYNQTNLFRYHSDFEAPKKGTIVINSITPEEGRLNIDLSIKELYGNILMGIWGDESVDRNIGIFPLVLNISSLHINILAYPSKEGIRLEQVGDITVEGDYDRCGRDKQNDYSGDNLALGCTDKDHAAILWDVSTPHGALVYQRIGSMSETKYKEAVAKKDYRTLDANIADNLQQIVATLFGGNGQTGQITAALHNFGKPKQNCDTLPFLSSLQVSGATDEDITDDQHSANSIFMDLNWDATQSLGISAAPLSVSQEGVKFFLRPTLTAYSTTATLPDDGSTTFDTLTRNTPLPETPFYDDKPGIGVLASEQMINQTLQLASMNGFARMLGASDSFVYTTSKDDFDSDSGIGGLLTAIFLMNVGENNSYVRLAVTFPQHFAPAVELATNKLILGLGGLKLDVYDYYNPLSAPPIASFKMAVHLHFNVMTQTPDPEDPLLRDSLLDIRFTLDPSLTVIDAAVSANSTDTISPYEMVDDQTIRSKLQQTLNQVIGEMLGVSRCYHLVLPADLSQPLVTGICDPKEDDPAPSPIDLSGALDGISENLGITSMELGDPVLEMMTSFIQFRSTITLYGQ